ncbi:MAG: hypothetical protein U1E65_28975 [Myxococcota bacterium]
MRGACLVLLLLSSACSGAIGIEGRDGGGTNPDAGTDVVPPTGGCPARGAVTPGASFGPLGVSGGNVRVVHALGGGTLLAATAASQGPAGRPLRASGLYRSGNGGRTFDRVLADVEVQSIVGTTRIYAAVGGLSANGMDGVYVSEDDGKTFSRFSDGLFPGARPRRLALAPGAPERVYLLVEGVASDPGAAVTSLYLRDNGGSWTALAGAGFDPASGGPVRAIAADPQNRDRVVALDGAGFYDSQDAGANFMRTDFSATFFPMGARNVSGVWLDPGRPGRVLVATAGPDGLFESGDGGRTFALVRGSPSDPIYDVAVGADSTWLATESHGLMRSTDGQTYQTLGACVSGLSVSAVALAGDAVFVGTAGGGVFRSADRGQSFAPSEEGMDELFGRVFVRGDRAWLSSPAGLFRLSADRRRFDFIFSAGPRSIVDLAIDPADPNRILLATDEDQTEHAGDAQAVLILSLDSGALVPASGFTGRNVARVIFDPTRPDRVYAFQRRGTREDPQGTRIGVFVSQDRGQSFAPTDLVGYDSFPAYPYAFTSSPLVVGLDGAVFAGTLADGIPPPKAIWRSLAAGANPTQVWNDADDTDVDRAANGLYVDPAGALWVAGRTKGALLSKSSDGGGSFMPVAMADPMRMQSVVDVAFGAGTEVLVAAGAEVLYAQDGAHFTDLGAGFSNAYSAAILPGSPAIFFVSTMGEGLRWRAAP